MDEEPPGATAALIERALALVLVALLLWGVLLVLRPFATAILFGGFMTVGTWPLRRWLVRRGLRPGLAAAVLLAGFVLFLAVPVLLVAPGLAAQIGNVVGQAQGFVAALPATPPDWLRGVPLLGEAADKLWAAANAPSGGLFALLSPYAGTASQVLIDLGTGLAQSALEILLSLVVTALLWSHGDAIGEVLAEAAGRLGGSAGLNALRAAEGAVRGVAWGTVGTALLQGVAMGGGLAVAGVPAAAALGFLTFVFAVSQVLGPLLVAIFGGAAWWLERQGATGWAIFALAWGVVVMASDNVVRPLLMRSNVAMPLALVIVGVLGGMLAFGFLGLFVGPALLAVAYALLTAWRRRPAH